MLQLYQGLLSFPPPPSRACCQCGCGPQKQSRTAIERTQHNCREDEEDINSDYPSLTFLTSRSCIDLRVMLFKLTLLMPVATSRAVTGRSH